MFSGGAVARVEYQYFSLTFDVVRIRHHQSPRVLTCINSESRNIVIILKVAQDRQIQISEIINIKTVYIVAK